MKRYCYLLLLPLLASCSGGPDRQPLAGYVSQLTLTSPDGTLTAHLGLDAQGAPLYDLSYAGRPVVTPSRLGLRLREGCLCRGFQLTDSTRASADTTWHPVWGEEDSIRDHHNALVATFTQPATTRRMEVEMRLFDDGLGLRYRFPEQDSLVYFTVLDELTEFGMAGDHTAWWISGDYDTQEYDYTESRLSQIGPLNRSSRQDNTSQAYIDDWAVQTALQMRSDDSLYINLHEAALVDYSCMSLVYDPRRQTFKAALTPNAVGEMAHCQTPCVTPWRTVMVTNDARKTLASRLILNLNEPCAYDDVSWIKPVKYVGVWWEMITNRGTWSYTNDYRSVRLGQTDYAHAKPNGTHAANNDNVRAYIDFAADNGFDQVLVEGWNVGWEDWFGHQKDDVFDFVTPYPDFDLAALNDYAHQRGVRLMMHHETSASLRNYERHLDEAYRLMVKHGYNALKSGYVGSIVTPGEHHYGQWAVNHYLHCVKRAADYRLCVNAHEAVRPTGLCRTYPNLIGNESARGTEYESFGGNKPFHTTILPFTRLQGGPMDYTPGILDTRISFLPDTLHSVVHTTLAKQLALYVTMYSPLQMAADVKESYQKYADAFQFIKDVGIDWRRSVYLEAEPGSHLTIAREEKGTGNWYVGGITGEQPRDASVDLAFLPAGDTFHATIYRDGPDAHYLRHPDDYVIERRDVTSADRLTVHCAASGGFAISLTK